MKKILLLTTVLIIICNLSYSAEKNLSLPKNNSYFIQNERLDFSYYSSDSIPKIKFKKFTKIAIAGTIVFGISWIFVFPGIGLTIYGWDNKIIHNHYWSYGHEVYEVYEDLTTFYVGAGVLLLGLISLFTGLPLMIVGWVMRAHYKSKVSIFIDSDNKRAIYGLSIKF